MLLYHPCLQAGVPDPAPAGFEEYISPLVVPSPRTQGEGIWSEAVRKAKEFVSDLTLEEKVNLTTGTYGHFRAVGCAQYTKLPFRCGFARPMRRQHW